MKFLISEQFSLIKQNYIFPNKQSQCSTTNESIIKLRYSLFEQIECLRGENASKNNIISKLLNKDKVLFSKSLLDMKYIKIK